jgi:hypothetical protein
MRNTATIKSLAVLKATWDVYHQDYIENFVPLLCAALRRRPDYRKLGFSVEDMTRAFSEDYGLVIPYHPAKTIIRRAKHRGYVTRAEHKYFPEKRITEGNEFDQISNRTELQEKRVIAEFIGFCKNKFNIQLTEKEAAEAMIGFLKHYDLDVVVASTRKSILPDVRTSKQQKFLFVSFVRSVYDIDSELYLFLVDIAVGHIIATVILNENLDNFAGCLQGQIIYLDTSIILKILDLESTEDAMASGEFVSLLRLQGADLRIFQHTRDETVGIIERCRSLLRPNAFDPLKASTVCLSLWENGYRESDIDEILATLERRIAGVGIHIVPAPDPNYDVRYQIDAEKLRRMIVEAYRRGSDSFDEHLTEYMIDRDIKSIEGIYKLRKGNRARQLTRCSHVFITQNHTMANVVMKFDEIEHNNAFAIPVCLTDVFVGTLIWLDSPNVATSINKRKLIANCYAALNPSVELIKRFVEIVDDLRRRDKITEDEYLLIRRDRIGRDLLVEKTYGEPNRLTPGLAASMVAEAKERMRQEQHDELVRQQRLTSDLTQELTALRARETGRIRRRQMRADRFAEVVSWVVVALVGVFCVLSIIVASYSPHWLPDWLRYILLGLATLFGVGGALFGINVKDSRQVLRRWVSRKLRDHALHFTPSG